MKNPIKQLHSDRFIPVRSQSAPKNTITNRLASNNPNNKESSSTNVPTGSERKQLTFSKSLSTRGQSVFEFLSSLPNSCKTSTSYKQSTPLNINCFKIIDVPGVVDNFYYNTMDISKEDFVAVGLGNDLHMFRETDSQAISFSNRKSNSLITCVKFSLFDEILISADQDGYIEINDTEKVKSVRIFKKHFFRVGRVETDVSNPSLFYSGSKDYIININDLREKKAAVSSLKSHKSEICGLSLKENYLASGANDGTVKVWDVRSEKLLETFNHHKGAVKALSWCPWRSNILVSGGGRKDKQILVYDFLQKKVESTIQVNHQITDICWRNSTQELIYSYGKENKGSIRVNNYFNPTNKSKKLTSHTGRVIGLRVNKNRDNIVCSLSADESLRYWDLDNFSTKVNAQDIMNNNFSFE